ncbi:MAG: SDR family oxidoreductase [Acidobacteriota bacterium]|nr:SDR family oxidoreductase [Blastocatellia bacterium]MDW8239369.1 SDR family oxidoreductase [Acidobacteriota bacterium]
MHIQDKVALITGGARIGRTVAVTLAQAGADVVLTYHRSRDIAQATVRDVQQQGRRAIAVQTDVSQAEQVRALVAQALSVFDGIDILIYMASVYEHKSYEDLTEADWDRNLNVDLKGAFLCVREVESSMKARGGGRIITVADWGAASGRPRYRGYLPYYVAKYGLIGLTQALALELASFNILVNCIAPGPILPPPTTTPEQDAAIRAATPLGHWGGAEEVAKVVVALIESEFITGECIRVDGGKHLR